MEFATSAGIAGRHRLFSVGWEYSPSGAFMTLNAGRQTANLIATLRFASNLSL
jgi:hypothetical protein